MLRLRVYNKSDNPLNRISWIIIISISVLIGIGYMLDFDDTYSKVFISASLPAIVVLGISRIIDDKHRYGSYGKVYDLSVREDSLAYDDVCINFTDLDRFKIRVKVDVIQEGRAENNDLEISTIEGKTYKLGLLVMDKSDIAKVDKMVDILKEKGIAVDYKNYLSPSLVSARA